MRTTNRAGAHVRTHSPESRPVHAAAAAAAEKRTVCRYHVRSGRLSLRDSGAPYPPTTAATTRFTRLALSFAVAFITKTIRVAAPLIREKRSGIVTTKSRWHAICVFAETRGRTGFMGPSRYRDGFGLRSPPIAFRSLGYAFFRVLTCSRSDVVDELRQKQKTYAACPGRP